MPCRRWLPTRGEPTELAIGPSGGGVGRGDRRTGQGTAARPRPSLAPVRRQRTADRSTRWGIWRGAPGGLVRARTGGRGRIRAGDGGDSHGGNGRIRAGDGGNGRGRAGRAVGGNIRADSGLGGRGRAGRGLGNRRRARRAAGGGVVARPYRQPPGGHGPELEGLAVERSRRGDGGPGRVGPRPVQRPRAARRGVRPAGTMHRGVIGRPYPGGCGRGRPRGHQRRAPGFRTRWRWSTLRLAARRTTRRPSRRMGPGTGASHPDHRGQRQPEDGGADPDEAGADERHLIHTGANDRPKSSIRRPWLRSAA